MDVDPDYLRDLLGRIRATKRFVELRDLYDEAFARQLLHVAVDASGATLEYVLTARRAELLTDPLEGRIQPGSHDRLRQALTNTRITTADMATHCGHTPETIRRYLHGRTRPTEATFERWAAKTGVTVDWLLTGA